MKILKLKFKNINSLYGEWEIDFTKPAFTDNGLFAITGKTGAGKSSILDAISLALYGKTPRVVITGQSNDVMTRGTSDCYAEVVIEIGGKKWKSSWKQNRNRNKNLNDVIRRIADGADNIYAEKVKDCDRKIEEITGLKFDQFTKVIMLAQGSFAAFLQADNADKGELLEQITGTEIYGEISKKVYERNKKEKEVLDTILLELGVIKLLSTEEAETLKREIEALNTEKSQADSELVWIEAAKKWFTDLAELHNQIEEAKQKLPVWAEKVEWSEKQLAQAHVKLEEAKTEKENCEKILVTVRELDTKTSEKVKSLNSILLTVNELENSQLIHTKKQAKQARDFSEAKAFLQNKQEWIAKNAQFESLTGEFPLIENQNTQLNRLLGELKAVRKDFENAQKDAGAKNSILKQAIALLAEKELAFNEKEKELKAKKIDLETILSGKELAAWQEEKEQLIHFGIQIKSWIEAETVILETQKNITSLNKFIASSELTEMELSRKISENQTLSESIKKQILLLEDNLKLARMVQSLDERRKELEDGKPCPLCGSLEHPYALGNELRIGEKDKELKKLKEQDQRLTLTIQQDDKTKTKLIADASNACTNKANAEKSLLEIKQKRDGITTAIKTLQPDFQPPTGEDRLCALEVIHQRKQNESKQIALLVSKATEKEKAIRKLQDVELPQLQKDKQTAEKEKTETELNLKLVEQKAATLAGSVEDAEKKCTEKNAEFLSQITKYGTTDIGVLKSFLTEWNSAQKAIEAGKEQVNQLERMIALTQAELESLQQQIEAKTTERQRLETEKETLTSKRVALFGDKRVEEEEKLLKLLVEKAEIARTEAEKSKVYTQTELAKIQAVIFEKEKEREEKQALQITEKSYEILKAEYAEKKAQSDNLSQQIGAKGQTLRSNEENVRKNRKKLDEKEAQQRVCAQWGSLNELIGHNEGKKYRDFAQALTFEYLTGLANRQLRHMSERYILKSVYDDKNPFDLSVIDKYQNGEERTAKNLSGGEKFIISLSLALGLATMASKNMNIDTMFIDEGFGTLDSDYLDVALTALSNLQNEGKLIGVISHLTELKERIPTHISVIQKGNGHSRIEMPF